MYAPQAKFISRSDAERLYIDQENTFHIFTPLGSSNNNNSEYNSVLQ